MDLINRIERVTTKLNEKADGPEGLVDDWQDAAGRFGVWTNAMDAGIAASSGAQKLVSRLYMSSHLVTAVKTLLDGLMELLTDASLAGFDSDDMNLGSATSAARRPLSRASSRSASSDEVEADTVASEYHLLDLINHILNGLHAMTPALLNPAPHDAITSSKYSHIALTQEADAKHLEEKYPEAPISLRQRLGRLNWHRRILRDCAKMHKESTSSTQEDVADPQVEYAVSEAPVRSQMRPPASIAPTTVMPADSMAPTQTNVSTEPSTLPSSQSVFDAPRHGNDSQSSIGSMSSYAATVRPQDEKLPCPVPPPGCLEGQPFDCDICYRRITNVKGNRKWKRHVMQDLRPYVCTYGGCRIQDVMFASRREWFEHEMTIHYITYVCIPPCQEVFVSYVEFCRHLKDAHSSSISDQQVEHIAALRKTCDFPDSGVLCPLCREPCPTMKKLEKHLGGDLEQIALFSLPPMVGNADSFDDDDDDDDNDDDMDAISNASSEEMDVKDKMELFDRKGFGGASAGTTTSSLEIQPEHVALGIPYCRRSGKPEVTWMLKNFESQRPYSCTSLCGQQFSIKARWKAHEELNFPRAWWLCKFCADIFPRKDRLRDHKKKQHGQSKINADEQHTAKQRERFFRPCFFACGYIGDDFDQWIDHVDKHFAIDVMKGTCQGETAEAVAGNVLSILKERQKQATSIAGSLELPSGQDSSRTVRGPSTIGDVNQKPEERIDSSKPPVSHVPPSADWNASLAPPEIKKNSSSSSSSSPSYSLKVLPSPRSPSALAALQTHTEKKPVSDDDVDLETLEADMAAAEAKEARAKEEYAKAKAAEREARRRKEGEESEAWEAILAKAEREAEAAELAREQERQAGGSGDEELNPLFTYGSSSNYYVSNWIVATQIEYYFSIQNLSKDFYLRKCMDSDGWVPLSVLANFKRIEALFKDNDTLSLRMQKLTEFILQVSNSIIAKQFRGTGWYVRKAEGWKDWVLPKEEGLPIESFTLNPIPESRLEAKTGLTYGEKTGTASQIVAGNSLQAQDQRQMLLDPIVQQYQFLQKQEQELRVKLHQRQQQLQRQQLQDRERPSLDHFVSGTVPPRPILSQPSPELSRPTPAFTTPWTDEEKRKHMQEMVRLKIEEEEDRQRTAPRTRKEKRNAQQQTARLDAKEDRRLSAMSFPEFVHNRRFLERKEAQTARDRTQKLNELLRFSRNFKLKTPLPTEIARMLGKDPEKQKVIIEKNSK